MKTKKITSTDLQEDERKEKKEGRKCKHERSKERKKKGEERKKDYKDEVSAGKVRQRSQVTSSQSV